MKKTLIAVAAAAALTTSAFAEITFGSWLRVLAAPVASNGEDTVTSMGNSWGWGARVARLDIHAVAEDGKAGFEMGAWNSRDGLAGGDDAYLWAKPVDQVKVSYGNFDSPTPLRGDFCYGSWNWMRPTSSWIAEDEGLLMSGKQRNGVKVEVTPVDNLYVLAIVPIDTEAKKAEDTYKNMQAGFAYNIEGVGKIKSQMWFDYTAKTKAQDAEFDKTIEAAFDLTSVENLYVGVGFQTKVWDKADNHKNDQKTKIAAAASYQVNDELKVSASGAYFMFGKKKSEGGVDPMFQLGAGIDYNLGDGMSLSSDVRYVSKKNDSDNTDHLAFSVGVTKGISSNGYIGAAFQCQTNSGNWATNVIEADTSKKNDKLTWCVPVAISCWF